MLVSSFAAASWRVAVLLWLAGMPLPGAADPCRLDNPEAAARARALVPVGGQIVRFCWYCEGAEPFLVRVKSVTLQRSEPAEVEVTGWADDPPSRHSFPLSDLVRAERDGSGPLADFIRRDVERRNADTTGYLGPNDPYLVAEKRAQYALQLGHVRQDHDMRSWTSLFMNGELADPRLLYVPGEGDDVYRSLGSEVGCSMGRAPEILQFRPIPRDPAKAAPPIPYVADVTGQCYDGACPRSRWRTRVPVELLADPDPASPGAARLGAGEAVQPIRTQAHVVGSRARVTRDHERFFEGDALYVLDSQAEGFYRVWHYGETLVLDATGIDMGPGWDACSREPAGCWARAEGRPAATWWAKVRHPDGREGWLRDPLEFLDGVLESD